MSTNAKIEYVLFDMDGLLIDSERVYTEVTNNILGRYGQEMTWDIKAGLMGKPEREAAAHLLSFFPNLPQEFTIETYLSERRVGQDALWPTVQPLPGVLKLVQHLRRHNIPIAVATGSQRRNYDQKSSHLMDVLFGHFDGKVVCADDGLIKPGRGKPHPDIFLITATTQLGKDVGEGEESEEHVTDAQRAERAKGLIFEDAIPGVQAGKRAGMKVVWVPDPNLAALGDRGMEAVAPIDQPDSILESLEHFLPEQWGLPPYDA
ncbi:HAD-like protein [Irpex rosettiformis]|uniref:HAD-like protein n=1 Tax=Irpex rosettiformis TaxID=378272 RepID=A0ACB8U1J9_9APHY|nr:HAD-like protein [Irpex rosettiformis]